MSRIYTSGFTIIETMLFLGITGLLVMGILAGAGTSINVQRYRDSVTSLQATLQSQYSKVTNVMNARSAGWSCNSNAQVTSGAGTAVGQSDCVILGRFITTTDNMTLSMSDVVGYVPSTTMTASDDLTALKQYALQVSPIAPDNYSVEWGASLLRPGSTTPAAFSLLIVRSPSSGIIRTFISPTVAVADRDVGTMVTADALTQSLKVCVASGGGLLVAKSAVSVIANATSASGVETLGEGSSQC